MHVRGFCDRYVLTTRWYDRGMRAKTSVSLTRELLAEIDRVAGRDANRSEFLEKAAWDRIALLKRRRREARDARILNRRARALNSEAFDVLEYQADL
jgi:metal-responsive CopG/Arc/MetJ family transcriptional regulator